MLSLVLLCFIATSFCTITPNFTVGIDFRRDGAIETATIISPDGAIFYALTDTRILAINTQNRQKIGSFSFDIDEKPIKFVIDHTAGFAYVFLDDLKLYQNFLMEVQLQVVAGNNPSVTFTRTGRKMGLPNRLELGISQTPTLIFTQQPTAFVSEQLRRVFYWERIFNFIPTQWVLRSIDVQNWAILNSTTPRSEFGNMALFSPHLSTDGLSCFGILQNTFLYSPAVFVKIDLVSMNFLINFDLSNWTNLSNQGEYVMTLNSLQNQVYLTQMFPATPRYIFRMNISNQISIGVFSNVSFFGSIRELALNSSDTRLFASTVGAPGDVGIYVFNTVTRTLIGNTIYNFPTPDITAYDGAIILSRDTVIFTTKRGNHFAYPAILFSLNIGNLIGTVYNRENPSVTMDNLLHRIDMFQFTPDNSQILVVGFNDSNYDINILSLNAVTLAIGSRVTFKLPYSIWSWPIFLGSAVNSTTSTLHLFYFFRSTIAYIVVDFSSGLSFHSSTQGWTLSTPSLSSVSVTGSGFMDLERRRQYIQTGSIRSEIRSLNNISINLGNISIDGYNKIQIDSSGLFGFWSGTSFLSKVNLTTFTTVANASYNFNDIVTLPNYVLGLLTSGIVLFESSLNELQTFSIMREYQVNPDRFMYDPSSHFGFVHSVRGSVNVDKWTGEGGLLLPFQLIGANISQNTSGIELIYTGDEGIFSVMRRSSDNTYLFLSRNGYIYTYSASLISDCNASYCRVNFTVPPITSGWSTTGLVTSGAVTTGGTIPNSCGTNNFTAPTGAFQRRPYQNGDTCQWNFRLSSIYARIEINIVFFDTETCCDYLTIFDGPDIYSPVIGRFSGNNVSGIISTSGNIALVTFVSDAGVTGQGFTAYYTGIAVPTLAVTTVAPGVTTAEEPYESSASSIVVTMFFIFLLNLFM